MFLILVVGGVRGSSSDNKANARGRTYGSYAVKSKHHDPYA